MAGLAYKRSSRKRSEHYLQIPRIRVRWPRHPIDSLKWKRSAWTGALIPRGKMIFPIWKICQVYISGNCCGKEKEENVQFELPPKSLSIRHSGPAQKHQHSNNDYRSNRPNLVTHRRRVSQRRPHRRVTSCSVRVARKFVFSNFRSVSPGTMRLPTVWYSTERVWRKNLSKQHAMGQIELHGCIPWHWAFHRNLLWLNRLLCHRHPPPDRNNSSYDRCPTAKCGRGAWHLWRNFCHSTSDRRMPPSCDRDLILAEWRPPSAHSCEIAPIRLCPRSMCPTIDLEWVQNGIDIKLRPGIRNCACCHLPSMKRAVSTTYSSISPNISLIFFFAFTNICNGEFS